MFLIYEENYVPDCDVADEFALFTKEDDARAEMERRKLCYLEQDGFSLPDTVGEDADRICLKVDGDVGKIYICLIKLDPQ